MMGNQRSSCILTSLHGCSSWKQMVSVSRYLSRASHTSARFFSFGAADAGAEGSEGESDRASMAREASEVCTIGTLVRQASARETGWRETDHGEGVALEHLLLVVPLGSDEVGESLLLSGNMQGFSSWRLERPSVEQDLVACRGGHVRVWVSNDGA
jgi:hypothetical protein